MANHKILNQTTLAGLEDLDSQIRDAMCCLESNPSKIARLSGVNRKIFNEIHKGSTFPGLDKVIMIADALGMDEITIKWR